MIRKISVAFAGGALGGLIDSFNIWFMGKFGISDLLGMTMKPEFTAPWLYQRMFWGGIWMPCYFCPSFGIRSYCAAAFSVFRRRP